MTTIAPDLTDEHNTIMSYDPVRNGAIVTILDSDGQPQLIAFDLEDLDWFAKIAVAVREGDPARSQEDRTRITPRGLEILRVMLGDDEVSSS